jgi:TetR/AcrR family transcriptional repressor of nem operon
MPRTKQNDKRSRLIEAADTLIYRSTFHTTTLADIAKEADVPLGNVYYYFKTKEAIISSVISARSAELKEFFAEWEQISSIRERLIALVNYFVGQSENLSKYGCPIGSLCQELGKQGGAIASLAAKLMHDILNWTQAQFTLSNLPKDEALRLSEYLLSSLQGTSLLTLTFKNTDVLNRQSALLSTWIEEKVGSSLAPTSCALPQSAEALSTESA